VTKFSIFMPDNPGQIAVKFKLVEHEMYEFERPSCLSEQDVSGFDLDKGSPTPPVTTTQFKLPTESERREYTEKQFAGLVTQAQKIEASHRFEFDSDKSGQVLKLISPTTFALASLLNLRKIEPASICTRGNVNRFGNVNAQSCANAEKVVKLDIQYKFEVGHAVLPSEMVPAEKLAMLFKELDLPGGKPRLVLDEKRTDTPEQIARAIEKLIAWIGKNNPRSKGDHLMILKTALRAEDL
jgi:hypothetical protein